VSNDACLDGFSLFNQGTEAFPLVSLISSTEKRKLGCMIGCVVDISGTGSIEGILAK